MPFQLHPRLEAGGHFAGKHGICQVFLKNNARYPWLVLVPEVDPSLTELHQLSEADYQSVTASIRHFATFIDRSFDVEKVNVGAIGNLVPQLHIHLVGRREGDPAWPAPVWGHPEKASYSETERHDRLSKIQQWMKNESQSGDSEMDR